MLSILATAFAVVRSPVVMSGAGASKLAFSKYHGMRTCARCLHVRWHRSA